MSLVVSCDANIAVQTDRALFERILRNILDNAIKYSDEGLIFISANLQPNGQTVSIAIGDQGIGIAASDQDSIFDEFFQVRHVDGNNHRGLGLGLSIVQRLTALLNIQVAVDSVLGQGTTVQLTMPAQRSTKAQLSTKAPAHDSALRGLSVLVLDDEPTVRSSMHALLTEIGCTVSLAANSDEAIALVRANHPQILLADMRLQNGATGIDTVHAIRDFHPNLRTILISGDTEARQQSAAQKAGLTLLYKPVDLNALVSAIRNELVQPVPIKSHRPTPHANREHPPA